MGRQMGTLRLIIGIVCVSMLAPLLPAQTPQGRNPTWSNVQTLETGQRITVETIQPKQKLKGRIVSSSDEGVTIQTSRSEIFVAKANVQRITRKRSLKPALAIGAASGLGIYAMVAPRSDFTKQAHTVMGAAFATIGALAGWGFGSIGRTKVVYEAGSR